MTLAALLISEEQAKWVADRFRAVLGRNGEIKGSRIDLAERAFLIELLAQTDAEATIGIALSATQPEPGEDRGLHDVSIYATLLDQVVGGMLPRMQDCGRVLIDDGRYSAITMSLIRRDVADIVGTCGSTSMEKSDRADGLQLADVIANSFFTRALPGIRQARIVALLQPFIDSGRMRMQILTAEAQREHERSKKQKRRH